MESRKGKAERGRLEVRSRKWKAESGKQKGEGWRLEVRSGKQKVKSGRWKVCRGRSPCRPV